MEPRPLTFVEKLFVKIGSAYSRRHYGDATPQFIAELIRHLGVKGFFAWGEATDQVKDLLAQRWDWATGEFLLGFGALWNGCTYCSRTHIAAGNVYWHHEKGELFPISEDEVIALQRLLDHEILSHIEERLSDAKYDDIRKLLLRQFELKAQRGGAAQGDDDHIEMANDAWDWATECSIVVERDPVPPISPIGKNKAAVAAYRAARGGPATSSGIEAQAGVTDGEI